MHRTQTPYPVVLNDMGNPSPELAKKILLRIDNEERRRLLFHAIAFCAALLGSVALAVYGAVSVTAAASQSGFMAFVSLFFSDFSAAMASFSDFAFSIIESFPVVSAALLLSGIFFALWSAANFIKEVATLRRRTFAALS